ncbi:putative nicotinate-nucleotide pyrophosphorylase [Clostridium bornimense]|uniref:Probable nicotinate-nucleotide pyrophosphorylase [carboxylating] n=1 Tax=Clostridium bornimense TaxID=1216932 RepID=W6S1H1_9CLOT|nr:carboxylating nicotinate-nucleotide diphosphorylase [Clostridium bornimense]CDM69724.1 putative nicotinate-nucleotide pyrophosphorylase [Clostridium bornimense]
MNWLIIDEIIKNALKEDVWDDDITSSSILSKHQQSTVDVICKEDGIIAGLDVFKRVFFLLGDVEVSLYHKDGDFVKNGEILGNLKGNTLNILKGERVALNLLQHLSGIATTTNKYVQELSNTSCKLLDTRKTTPGLRILEKYAVKVGGGCNHRFNLSDGVLLKDNHVAAAGGVKNAIEKARNSVSFVRKIEVEVETLDQVKEALDAKADIIMLDNMDNETTKKAVDLIKGNALIEASGNMNLKRIRSVAETGVDYISVGALTHSVKALDISMKNLKNL